MEERIGKPEFPVQGQMLTANSLMNSNIEPNACASQLKMYTNICVCSINRQLSRELIMYILDVSDSVVTHPNADHRALRSSVGVYGGIVAISSDDGIRERCLNGIQTIERINAMAIYDNNNKDIISGLCENVRRGINFAKAAAELGQQRRRCVIL